MNDIKLIVTDIDGTLATHGEHIPQINIDAIRAAKELGVKVCACTARNWTTAKEILERAGLTDYCMLLNGSVILDVKTKEVQYRNRIAPEYVGPLVDIVSKYTDGITIEGTENMVICKDFVGPMARRGWDPFAPNRPQNIWTQSQIKTYSKEEFIEAGKDICNILTVWIDHDQHLPLYSEISEIGPFELSAADDDHVYIMAKDATKGLAVEILAGLYGVTAENVMCFGDSKNDASMLRWAGVGVAMGNANQLAKDSADIVTARVEEGGVGREIFRRVVNRRR
ncbi:MAG: Cof-type HAD-IIB family hydrolase [Clostridiales bacterium]|nr:Cof-type HAD-IIB family hydrolase [Clostridiales bacterium]